MDELKLVTDKNKAKVSKERNYNVEERLIFVGGSESAGHAPWNDLTGLITYARQAAARGPIIKGHKIPYSLLSKTLRKKN